MGAYSGTSSVYPMRSVDDILTDIGVRTFTAEELVEVGKKYHAALLEGPDEIGGLMMLPSYLTPVDPASLPVGKTAVIIETGGSNAYAGIVSVTNSGIAIAASHKAALPSRRYDSPEHYFTILADLLSPILDQAKPDALGIVWAGPANNEKRDIGNDARVKQLTKEFVIPGIYDETIVTMTKKYIGAKYEYLKPLPTVVMNDTVAVLLSCGAVAGGIVATGMNFAYATPDGIINTESGSFKGIPQTKVTNELDAKSEYPGQHINEKRTTGLYLPEYFKVSIEELKNEGYDVSMPEVVDAPALSAFAEKAPVTPGDEIYAKIAKILFEQSAQLVGTEVGSAIATYHADGPDEVVVPIEGSLFWGAPGYVDVATRAASEASGKVVKFVNIPHAGRVGAGVAALGTLLP